MLSDSSLVEIRLEDILDGGVSLTLLSFGALRNEFPL
jgi:hypothetical protein